MRAIKTLAVVWALLVVLVLAGRQAEAAVMVQCPVKAGGAVLGDLNHDGLIRADSGEITNPVSAKEVCKSITGGDGFALMADGTETYVFGFSDVTGLAADSIMSAGMLGANAPAPTIALKEGDEFYLTLTNVGMVMRPDLFDPHSVHWHGFPNASAVFDGIPEDSATINQGSSITYYYKVVVPGTYIYHCHVEAAEHIQMGMVGSLYVHPAQDGQSKTFLGRTYTKFAYNDGDGSTGYDKEFAILLDSFDYKFHLADLSIQPLAFAEMRDDYALINGRGYPDTANPGALAPPPSNGGKVVQPVGSLLQAKKGERVLLRLANLNVTRFYTLTALGIPMQVVGFNARVLRGPGGQNLYYKTTSVTTGGGESVDVLLDTANVVPGTYFLYTTNLNYLSNGPEDFGGMMTELVVTP